MSQGQEGRGAVTNSCLGCALDVCLRRPKSLDAPQSSAEPLEMHIASITLVLKKVSLQGRVTGFFLIYFIFCSCSGQAGVLEGERLVGAGSGCLVVSGEEGRVSAGTNFWPCLYLGVLQPGDYLACQAPA